ncbi:MAG: TIGR01244 family phosphatase [Halieaceae bacterium]|nr:TIGR01244 family phosphatase [Halieaceae bacterium]MCP5147281.1 TIGR01244 family phosphatase [Pseudomonadales bacterium]MCP5166767.1 TIGR01244 family phosphatase [Pseudomonadales bacterium]MCP5186722.1 TIGR01244 family phosphatase [Pseudomonadales bacterium]
MSYMKLTDTVAVAGQISAEQVREIAAAGFRVLVNNRPDGEDAGQPSGAEIEAAALAAGLEYHHLPVTGMNFPGPDVERMAQLLDDSSRPVFAFCRTGTRCTNLWVVTREEDSREEAIRHARALGFDLSMAARVLV